MAGIDAGSIYSEVRIKLDKLNADISSVNVSMDKLGKGVGDSTTKTSEKVTSGFNQMGVGAVLFGSILADLAQKGAEQLKEFAVAFDEANETISKSTGATGKDLQELNDVFNSVLAKGIEQSTQEVAAGLGELNVRFKATGGELETLTLQVAEFSDVTNTEMKTAVTSVSQVMNKWGIETADIGITLDKLAFASQESGIAVTALMGSLTQSAAQLQAANFSFDESVALLSAFEAAGVRTENVMMGLNKAIAGMGEAGIDSRTGIKDAFEAIKNAGSIVEATTIAVDTFGTRSGVELAKALRSGKVDIEAWTKSIANAEGTVAAVGKASDTTGDKIKVFGNQVKAAFQDFASGAMAGFISFWEAIPGPVKVAAGVFVGLLAAFAGVQAAIPVITAAWAALNAGFLATPLGAIVLSLAAVTAGVVGLTVAMDQQDRKKIAKEYSDIAKELNLTEKQLVALARAALDVKMPVREFAALQKQTGLTTKELQDFIKTAKDLGITNEDVLELNKNFGVSADQLQRLAYGMKGQDFGGFKEAAVGIEIFANNMGVSRDAVIELGLKMKGATNELKAQLEASRALFALQDKGFKDELTRIEYVEARKRGASSDDAARTAAAEAQKQAAKLETEKQNKAIDEAIAKRQKEEVKLNTQLSSGLLTQAQYNEALIKLNETTINQLLDINNGYKDGAGIIDGLIDKNKKLGASYSESSSVLKEWIQKYNDLDATAEETAQKEIEANRKIALSGVKAGSELEAAINRYYDRLRDDSANGDFLSNLKSTTDTVATIAGMIGGTIQDALSAANTAQLAEIDTRMQAELEAAGVAEKSATDTALAQIAAAQAAGDGEAEAEAKKALLKAQIEAKYQKEKAQLQYEADLAAWNNRWVMSIVDTASAVIEALPNVILSVASGIAGAVQTGIILANKPKAPSFATGGIVPGTSFTGDSVPINANSGEMVLTQAQQAKLFAMIESGQQSGGFQGGTFSCVLQIGQDTYKKATIKIMKEAMINKELTVPETAVVKR